MPFLASITISPALPSIAKHFQEEAYAEFLVRMLLTLPGLFIVLGAPLAGLVIDRYGKKSLLLMSLGAYGLAGISGYYLDSLVWLLLGRAVIGLAIAGLMTTTTTLVGDYFQGEARTKLLGLQGVFVGFSSVLFVFAGGVLADISWQTPFLVFSFAFVMMALVLYSVAEPKRSKQVQAVRAGFFPIPITRFIYPISFLSMVVFYLLVINLGFYLEIIGSSGSILAGSGLALTTLAAALISILFKRLKQKLSFRWLFAGIFSTMSVGYVILFLAPNYTVVIFGLIAVGMGMGLTVPAYNLLLLSFAPNHIRGRVVAGLTTSVFLGQFSSFLLAGPLADWIGTRGAFGIGSIILILMAGAFMKSPKVELSQ